MRDKDDKSSELKIVMPKGFGKVGDWYQVTHSPDGKSFTIDWLLRRKKNTGDYDGPYCPSCSVTIDTVDDQEEYQLLYEKFAYEIKEKNKAFSTKTKKKIIQDEVSFLRMLLENNQNPEVWADHWSYYYEPFHVIWDNPDYLDVTTDCVFAFDKMCWYYANEIEEKPTEKEISLALDTVEKTLPLYESLLKEVLLEDEKDTAPDEVPELQNLNKLTEGTSPVLRKWKGGKYKCCSLERFIKDYQKLSDYLTPALIRDYLISDRSGKPYTDSTIEQRIKEYRT